MKAKRLVIYTLSDVDGRIRYVGKTCVDPFVRTKQHRYQAVRKRYHTHLYCWWRSQPVEPTMDVVDEAVSDEELNELERFWIASLRAAGASLVNQTDGGDGQRRGFRPSAETMAKYAERSAPRLARVARAQELKAKAFAQPLEAAPVSSSKRVVCDQYGNRYESATHAARALGLNRGHISSVLAGHRRHTGGYQFKYAGEQPPGAVGKWVRGEGDRIKASRAHGGRPIFDQHGVRYETVAAAAQILKINRPHIFGVLNGRRGHVGGYRFTYLAPQPSV